MPSNCGAAEDYWESLDCKNIKPVNPKGNQHWVFIGRTNEEAPMIWPPDMKYWLIGKDPNAGKDWGLEEKGVTENEMVGWHNWLNGHEFEQTPRDGETQGSLACCSPWVWKEPDMFRGWLTTPSPVSTSPFSMSVSLFLSCSQVHQHHFSRFHIYALIYDRMWPTGEGNGKPLIGLHLMASLSCFHHDETFVLCLISGKWSNPKYEHFNHILIHNFHSRVMKKPKLCLIIAAHTLSPLPDYAHMVYGVSHW